MNLECRILNSQFSTLNSTMSKARQLSARQLAVIEDLFNGEIGEQAVLDKYKVSRKLYDKWLASETFVEQFDRRIADAYRQSAALIARYAPLAASKLVQLTDCEKEETARKACLDIISLPSLAAKKTEQPTEPQNAPNKQAQQLPPQTASRLLAVLAKERGGNLK